MRERQITDIMTSIYPIYEHDMTSLDRLARITFWNKPLLEVFWNPSTQQTFFLCDSKWFVRDGDSNIIESLCFFLGKAEPHQVIADSFMVFDQAEKHGRAHEEMLMGIYDCVWSDFACDRLVFHLNVRVFGWIQNKDEQKKALLQSDPSEAFAYNVRLAKFYADVSRHVNPTRQGFYMETCS